MRAQRRFAFVGAHEVNARRITPMPLP